MGTLLDLARSAATKEVDDERLDPAMEERRRKVLRQLAENPNIVRAVELADEHTDPNDLIIAVAIRGVATFEMRVPKAKVDAWTILGLVEKHSIRRADQEAPVRDPGKPAGILSAPVETLERAK